MAFAVATAGRGHPRLHWGVFGLPVFVVAEEMAGVPEIHRGEEEKPDYASAAHFLKPPIGRIHSSANDTKLASSHLLAQKVVFGEVYLFVKTLQFVKAPFIEKHEHAGAEWLMQAGQVLKEIVAEINPFIEPVALAANDIRGNAMQVFLLRQFDSSADQGIRRGFDIGVDEEYVVSVGQSRSGVAAD
jgi:hypothetical protein